MSATGIGNRNDKTVAPTNAPCEYVDIDIKSSE